MLHVLLLVLLLAGPYFISSRPSANTPSKSTVQVVKAVVVPQADLDAIKQRKDAQVRAERLKHERALALKRKKALAEKKHQQLLAKRKALKILEQKRLQQARQAAKRKALDLARRKHEELQRELLAKRKQQQLQSDLAKQMATEQESIAASRAQHIQTVVGRYTGLIQQAIGQHWLVPDHSNKKSCKLLIRLAPGGDVLRVSLIQSSGDPALDNSAQVAVYKASPLPVPANAELFENFRVFRLTVRPEQVVS